MLRHLPAPVRLLSEFKLSSYGVMEEACFGTFPHLRLLSEFKLFFFYDVMDWVRIYGEIEEFALRWSTARFAAYI